MVRLRTPAGSDSIDLFGVRGARFEEQLVKTLSEFGIIRRVVIYVNGILQQPREA